MISFFRCILLLALCHSAVIFAETPGKMRIKFATDANYYPFEYFAEDKTIQGFDIDIVNAICEASNLTCSFEHHRFDGLLLTLPFGRYDAVIAALDITEERLKLVDFSNSYYKIAPVFISEEQLEGEFSLSGKFIGVQANSSNQSYLTSYAKQDNYIVPYFSSEAALNDLKAKKIDAVFADFAVINNFLSQQKSDSNLVISRTEEVFVTQFSMGYGIAVKKGNDVLRERINKGLKLIMENGLYRKIYKKYFP